MSVHVACGDVLDAPADILFVTASTEPPRKGANKADVLGAIGSQLMRRLGPEAAEEFGDQLELPIRAGTAQLIELEPGSGVSFKQVCVLGALGHLDSSHKGTMSAALAEALAQAQESAAINVAICLPKGGWRLGKVDAVAALVSACDQYPAVAVTVYCLTEEEAREVSGLLRSLGICEA